MHSNIFKNIGISGGSLGSRVKQEGGIQNEMCSSPLREFAE